MKLLISHITDIILYISIECTVIFIYVSADIANTSITSNTVAIRRLMSKLQSLLVVCELEEAGVAEFVLRHGSHSHILL